MDLYLSLTTVGVRAALVSYSIHYVQYYLHHCANSNRYQLLRQHHTRHPAVVVTTKLVFLLHVVTYP